MIQLDEPIIPNTGAPLVEEEDTGAEEIHEPFDPAQIRIETKSMTVDLLLKRIRAGEIDLTPDFQREGGLWKLREQSRLIESLLIRIPIPAFYMDATNEEQWLVVDGLQRLTVLKRFAIEQSLVLSQLEFLQQYQGKRFRDLPRPMQRRIEETQVITYLIQPGTPEEVKFNIFKRINTGGLPLSSQEIRHALNQGAATKLLRELAMLPEFLLATAGGIQDRRMSDREVALRFLAFAMSPYLEYKVPDLDGFLHRKMRDLNRMADAERSELRRRFARSMQLAYSIFGNDAFRKRLHASDPRKPINKALFEAWSVNLDSVSDFEAKILIERKLNLRKEFIEIMNQRDFDAAVTQGTGDIGKVRIRFERIEKIIRKVLNDPLSTTS